MEIQGRENFREAFVRFAVERQALRFGEFVTKAGRKSPYFFNAGLFHDGDSLARFSQFYAQALLASGLSFDMLFGPAYKGIPLVSALAVALSARGLCLPFAYNRKEEKDHGEKGALIGAPIAGRTLIVDDVISAGTSVRESVELITAAGGIPAGVLIALDRRERGAGMASAVEEVEQRYNIPVIAVATLDHLINFLAEGSDPKLASCLEAVSAYRARYGTSQSA
ncbi:MAG: orotate phosphoribosyltransferase [Zoogloeaceae bacterium]|jgi:orotate phosphoribosyltransferase|nr:orotate phosphoribosyltransferase [Zoogloeaceae bacterium]